MNYYAGFWIRVAAYLIDIVVLYIAQFAIFAVLGVSLFASGSLESGASDVFATTGGTLAYLVTLVGTILYYVLMESSERQGTLGKIALGLIVTDSAGNRISAARATGRYFAKIVSAMILLIGFIMVAFTERKQGLHDLMAGTLVLKARPGEVGLDTLNQTFG
ncbi:RDD family protein [Parerythrobacter aurantius]|uniref:RDD family protein n=1 Tax=Parerythrobacter aurantius TaxID=3127706 RepID=UPI003244BD18